MEALIQTYLSPLILLEKPGSSAIILPASNIQSTSLTVEWTAPADDGGSLIKAYRVVILKIMNQKVTEPSRTSLPVGGLKRDTKYTVRVFARNAVFEGPAGEKEVETKYEGNKVCGIVLVNVTYHH